MTHESSSSVKMHLDAELLHHLGHKGIRVLAAWPWQSLLLQSCRDYSHTDSFVKPLNTGVGVVQAWLKQEFPLFSM